MQILPVLAFASFVLWLLAFPMEGPLLAAVGISQASHLFLLPHAAALALLGCCVPPASSSGSSRLGSFSPSR